MKIFVKPHLEDLYNTFVCVYFWDSVLATSSSPATLWFPPPRSCIPPYHSPPRRPWTPSASPSPPYPETVETSTLKSYILSDKSTLVCLTLGLPLGLGWEMREKVVVSEEWRERRLDWEGVGATRQSRGWNWLVRSLWRPATNWWQRQQNFTAVNEEFYSLVLFQVRKLAAWPAWLLGRIILVWLSSLGCLWQWRYICSMIKYNSIP